ncbi:MAG: hypothetical protein ACI9YH_003120 [Colwellia sp.]|jgi:hypothetical protein
MNTEFTQTSVEYLEDWNIKIVHYEYRGMKGINIADWDGTVPAEAFDDKEFKSCVSYITLLKKLGVTYGLSGGYAVYQHEDTAETEEYCIDSIVTNLGASISEYLKVGK